MRIFKLLFGGIASFFSIIFGGVIDTIKGALGFDTPEPVVTPVVGTVATVVAATVAEAVDTSAPEAVDFEPAEPASPLFAAAETTTLLKPRRRPGAAMSSFMDMAREIRPAA